jgi:hypothetical protein
MLFGGTKQLTQDMKDSFAKPFDTDSLKTFFANHIGDNSLIQIMSNFGIPSGTTINKDYFITALCRQFQRIVTDVADDVDDIVLTEYQQMLNGDEDAEAVGRSPLYPGDDLLADESVNLSHIVGFYEKFEHTWSITNTGTITWVDRRLECVNPKGRIRPLLACIKVPKVKPGEDVPLTVKFDARGCEGTQESLWEMKDNAGSICFPAEDKILRVIATVKNSSNNAVEV